MITGRVNADEEAVIVLVVRGPDQQEVEIECVIDTGYNGTLALSPEVIQVLVLPPRGSRLVMLADGNEVILSVFQAVIAWDGQEREVQVLEAEGGSVLGMALLRGYRLTVDVEDGGLVTIEKRVP